MKYCYNVELRKIHLIDSDTPLSFEKLSKLVKKQDFLGHGCIVNIRVTGESISNENENE